MGAAGEIPQASAAGLDELELELLLEALVRRFGYDYRLHERAPLKRKLFTAMQNRGLRSLSQLQDQLLHDTGVASALVRELSVPPAPLFANPVQSLLLREAAEMALCSTALPRVWLPDCAGAGEAWTLAIMLHELGLDSQVEIHATVPSDDLREEAEDASLPAAMLDEQQAHYVQAGGRGQLADYFHINGERAVLQAQLRSRINWAQYNLVTDASFNEFQMIVCQQAIQDFGPLLRQRVLQLFHDSLSLFGVLGLDRHLTPADAIAACYQPLMPNHPWHKRTL